MKSSKILRPLNKIDILIIIDLALICLALCLIQTTNFDLEVQKYFFDFENKKWLIDKNEPIKKFIFYQFPKILFGAAIIALIANLTLNFLRNNCLNSAQLLILFGLILIPLIGGNVKKFTNIYCPTQLEIYDGDKPYVKIFDSYPQGFHQTKRAQCFPAGHCVTGFSLLILFFAFRKKSYRLLGLAGGVILGWIMGFYQIAKGAHFFGDTLVSMLLCFLIAATIARIFDLQLAKRSD